MDEIYINSNKNNLFNNYPDLLTIADMQNALGIGRTKAYKLINGGEIKHLRIGKSIKVPKQYLIDFITQNCYNYLANKGISPVTERSSKKW